ncbi:hypothetical protein QBC36DRAFT_380620 [Triangularia setosa]|uniref:Heterokaryon incompatibility domain-containing protein n=1 Tax=Triangularia setosa TaxID=2587417 RepID=A0AAN6W445_9PEZI|nr:hypothetical protein QBC36DRAFT_380620 [Podospora setosa]
MDFTSKEFILQLAAAMVWWRYIENLDEPRQSTLAQHFINQWKEDIREQSWKLEHFLQLSQEVVTRSVVSGRTSSNPALSSLWQWDKQTEEELTEDERCKNHSLAGDGIFPGFLWECVYDARLKKVYIERTIRVLECVATFMGHHEEDVYRTLLSQVKTLRLKDGDSNAMACALDILFKLLSAAPISLHKVPAGRYRFIDARSFADGASLRVVESKFLPKNRYAAISYVWKVVPSLSPEGPKSTMTIKSADNADPISLDTFRITCRAAVQLYYALLWLDGFCIKQGDEDDKAWQI